MTGNGTVHSLLVTTPDLKGMGYYAPLLQQFTGLLNLDLSYDYRLPKLWLKQLPINLHTLKLYLSMDCDYLLSIFPATLTHLSISPGEIYCNVRISNIPITLTSLELKGAFIRVRGEPISERPALLSLKVTEHDSYSHQDIDALRHFLTSAPNLTSYSGVDWTEPVDKPELSAILYPERLQYLEVEAREIISQQLQLVATVVQYDHINITLVASSLTQPLPCYITTLSLHTLSGEDVQLLPVSLRSLTANYTGDNTDALSKLPHLRELDLTIDGGTQMLAPAKFTSHDGFTALKKLALYRFEDFTVPESVTDLNTQGKSVFSHNLVHFTSPPNIRYYSLNGLMSSQVISMSYQQLCYLTFLRVDSCREELPEKLTTLPSGNLKTLLVTNRSGERDGVPYTSATFLQQLMKVCTQFINLERLSLEMNFGLVLGGFHEIWEEITLPASITDLNLRIYKKFTNLVLPLSLTKLTLIDTPVELATMTPLRLTPLSTLKMQGMISNGLVWNILPCLPYSTSYISIYQQNLKDNLFPRDPALLLYRSQRNRYLHTFKVNQ